jgi:cytochrome c oxidase cbb3-type subunit 1
MNLAGRSAAHPVGRAVALHSLGWLVAANLVGVWLGVSLLWPALGDRAVPFTFGRWVPLHLDWQLYGWCALPLVGALLAWCFDDRHPTVRGHAQLGLGAWSLALGLGGLAWLGGTVSGKLFLDWHGWARPLLPAAMHVLWALLAAHVVWRWRRLTWGGRVTRVGALAVLQGVPTILYWAADRGGYPPVNPDSGGATGASLLGSTLGIVTLYAALPALLGLEARGRRAWLGWALGVSWALFAVSNRGNASHHEVAQIVALGALLAWIPLLPGAWRVYAWPAAAVPWLWAAAAWWTLLVATGWLTFLPGLSERLKFTHALVAHAHLAMAGLVTSVNAAIVVTLAGRAAPRAVFALWQGGCVIFVAAMLALGWSEAERAAELYRSDGGTQAWFALRLLGGLAMAGASVQWWWCAWRGGGEKRVPTEQTDYTEEMETGAKEGIV